MSTASNSLSLFLSEQFQKVRLVEVPDEVLNLIGKGEELVFKSSPCSPPASEEKSDKGGHLHLCGNNHSWLVKQVSTSNSLYITQAQSYSSSQLSGHEQTNPSNSFESAADDADKIMTDPDEENGDRDHLDPTLKSSNSHHLTAISKPTSILELLSISTTAQQNTIDEHLESFVPRLDFKDLDSQPAQSLYSCDDLLNSVIPAPTAQIRKTLAQYCIGNHWNGKAYRPTPTLMLETWKAVVSFAISHSANIDEILLGDEDTLSKIQLDEEMTSDIFKSVASMWKFPNGLFAENGLISEDVTASSRKLKPQETARWVGNLILQVAGDEGTELETETFVKLWEDVVPAGWVKYCSVEVLLPACAVVEGAASGQIVIRWVPFRMTGDNTDSATATQYRAAGQEKETSTVKTSTTKNKRKWHEKFAAQRNVKN